MTPFSSPYPARRALVRPASTLLIGLATALAAAACTTNDATVDPNTHKGPAKVVVSPSPVGLMLDSTITLKAVAYDSSGNAMTGAIAPVWSSDNLSIVDVSQSGVVKAIGVGTTVVRAEIDDVFGLDTVTVALPAPVLTRVVIVPGSATLTVNDTVTLRATSYSQFNALMTNPAAPTWTTSDSTIATVSSSGFVTAKRAGTATISGTIKGITGQAAITVNAPVVTLQRVDVSPDTASIVVGGTATFTATPYGSDGRVFAGAPAATWTTGDSTIATVSSGGVVTAKSAGATTVTATISGVRGTATIVTKAGTTSTATVNPAVRLSLKRLQTGGIDTLSDITVAGDHEETGDKELEGLVSYDLSSIAQGSTVQQASLTVGQDVSQSFNSPWTLGTLYVESASGFTLDEGTVPSDAVAVASANFGTIQVDVTKILQAAVAAHQSSVILRFRYAQLENNNGKIDYVWLNAGPINLSLSK